MTSLSWSSVATFTWPSNTMTAEILLQCFSKIAISAAAPWNLLLTGIGSDRYCGRVYFSTPKHWVPLWQLTILVAMHTKHYVSNHPCFRAEADHPWESGRNFPLSTSWCRAEGFMSGKGLHQTSAEASGTGYCQRQDTGQ